MRSLITLIILLILNSCQLCFAQEDGKADQEIDGFSLVQYDDNGEKKWEMNGRTAELEGDNVRIDYISALAFGDAACLKLKARKGDFNREEQLVHLRNDVVLKTSDGTMLTTDSLKWDAASKNVSTEELINIKKADFEVNGKGAVCNLENKTAELKENVTANMDAVSHGYLLAGGQQHETTITCDGPLEINYNKNKAAFLNNVKVEDSQGDILADRIDVYFDKATRRIKCVVARGNVKIVNGENVTYSEKAIYLVEQGRVILPKRPKLVIQSERSKQ